MDNRLKIDPQYQPMIDEIELLKRGIDPYGQDVTQDSVMSDPLMLELIKQAKQQQDREEYMKLKGGDMYHEMMDPNPDYPTDQEIFDMMYEGY